MTFKKKTLLLECVFEKSLTLLITEKTFKRTFKKKTFEKKHLKKKHLKKKHLKKIEKNI